MICIETSLPAAEIPRRLLRDRKRRKLQHSAVKLLPPPPKQVAAGLSRTISSGTPLPMILTSGGATWRVRTLFSLRALRSLLVLLKGILLLLLLPFRRRAIAVCGREAGARRGGMAIGWVGVEEEGGDGERSVRGFELLETDRGDTIFTQSWASVVVRTKGLVVLLHGLNEHGGRYNQFARLLNESGLKVYAMDWIGHGGSDGLHGYVHSLDYAVNDLITFLDKVLAENPGLPCFCFGHSTGGAIVLKAVMDPKVEACVQGVVLTSPAIHVEPSHPIVAAVAPIFSLLIPRYQFSAVHKKGPPVSRDPEALKAKYSDPLVFTGAIRVRTGYEILRISYQLQQNLCRVTVPFLVLHGTADTVTDPLGSTMLYQTAASPDKSIKLYDGLLHDLLFEPEKEEITRCIIEWLTSRLEASC